MRNYLILTATFAFLLLTACDSFVGEVREPNDEVNVEELSTAADVDFLLTGVRATWSDAYAFTSLSACLLSDQFRFGRNSDATFPTYRDLDNGLVGLDNNSVDAAQNFLGEYRRLADDLVGAARNAEYGDDPPITQDAALFEAHLHGAIARSLYATYVGLNPREGGGVIAESEFIPSPAMYDSARVKFEQAREFASTDRQNKFLASAQARSALYAGTEYGSNTGGYGNALEAAATLAQGGLKPGDEPVQLQFSIQEENEWYDQAGPDRMQVVAQDGVLNPQVSTYEDPDAVRSFPEIVENNPDEANRIPLAGVSEGAEYDVPDEDAIEYAQAKYTSEESPINFLTWEENHLIRAELEQRGFDAGDKSALELVNEVRSSFGLSDLSSVDLATIAQERDRTLFTLGARLVDQRRLDVVDWHLQDQIEGRATWQFLPIPQQERNANPNL